MRAIAAVILGVLLIAAAPGPVKAGWGFTRQISNAPHPARLKYNFGRSIAVDGAGVVHAAWLEEHAPDPPGHGTGRVMYSRSGNDGRTWQPPLPRSGPPMPVTGHPRLAAYGSRVYLAWHGLHDGSGVLSLYLRHSPDHGSDWGRPRSSTARATRARTLPIPP